MSLISIFRRAKSYALDRYFIKQPWLRQLVTKVLYGARDRDIHLFGTRLMVNSMQENGYVRAAQAARHLSLWRDEPASLLALAAVLRPGDTFVDIGANIGIYCCTLARLPGVKVVAFEANPETFQRLSANARQHGVDAHCLAVSERAETLEFLTGAVSHVFAAANHRNAYHNGGTVKVEAQPLDDLIKGDQTLVLKIDVEGHEPEVLRGAAKLISSGRVRAIMLDASPETRLAAAWLGDQGYRLVDPATFCAPAPDCTTILALRDKC